MKISIALAATALLIIGMAAYISLNSPYKEEDAAIDLSGEDDDVYL